jgi:hypothetical protein
MKKSLVYVFAVTFLLWMLRWTIPFICVGECFAMVWVPPHKFLVGIFRDHVGHSHVVLVILCTTIYALLLGCITSTLTWTGIVAVKRLRGKK